MNAIAVIAGSLLVLWILMDTFDTLLATNLRGGRLSFTKLYYRILWGGYRRMCVRIENDEHRERWLARFPEFSLADPSAVTWSAGQVRGPRSLPVTIGR